MTGWFGKEPTSSQILALNDRLLINAIGLEIVTASMNNELKSDIQEN